nr:tigger transposable element-derived protein 4-like [Vanessa tameamea]
MSGAKRKQINIEGKSRIISKLMSGVRNKDLAKEYGVSHSTISTIWNEREKIQNLYDKNFLKMKRARTMKRTKIEEALLKWFKYQRTNNVPINGPILQQKANDFAQRFVEDFVCSSSWIQRFRARYGIVGGKMSGEAASVDKGAVEDWMTQKWPTLCEGYTPDDIFNADETDFFYNLTPDRTLKFKGENCSRGKMPKTRLPIMVAADMTGSCKKKLSVIGKSKKPRCFKSVRSLPVTYENNVKSWMTSEIFERWLRDWDWRKVLLLVDNCPAHPAVTNLKLCSCHQMLHLYSNLWTKV